MSALLPLFRALCVAAGILAAALALQSFGSQDFSRPSMSRGTTWLHGASGPIRGGKG